MEWTQITITSLMTAIVTLAGQYFVSYLRKKGENLATKEDIGRLTEIVENVKSQFAVDLEFIRFNLGNKSTIQRLAAEKEFGALSEIDRKSTRLNSSHTVISYAVFCLKK